MKTLLSFSHLTFLLSAQESQLDTKQRVRAVHDLAKQGDEAIPKIAPYVTDPDLTVCAWKR